MRLESLDAQPLITEPFSNVVLPFDTAIERMAAIAATGTTANLYGIAWQSGFNFSEFISQMAQVERRASLGYGHVLNSEYIAYLYQQLPKEYTFMDILSWFINDQLPVVLNGHEPPAQGHAAFTFGALLDIANLVDPSVADIDEVFKIMAAVLHKSTALPPIAIGAMVDDIEWQRGSQEGTLNLAINRTSVMKFIKVYLSLLNQAEKDQYFYGRRVRVTKHGGTVQIYDPRILA